MRAIVRLAGKLFLDRRAATAVEYGFILALIVIAMIATLRELAGTTVGVWTDVSAKVQSTN